MCWGLLLFGTVGVWVGFADVPGIVTLAWFAIFVAPGFSSATALSVVSLDNVSLSWAMVQLLSEQVPQKAKRQHVVIGMPVAHMRAWTSCPLSLRTQDRVAFGNFLITNCFSL